MARLTEHEQGLTVETFYGINPTTFEIESVSLTKGGVLRKHGRDMQFHEHALLDGHSPQTEIVIVWHLRELISFPEGIFSEEEKARSLGELKAKAAKMKEENENTLGG
jgi:hypothetical protein